MSKQTLEPLFRMALSRIEQAGEEIGRIAEVFPADSVADAYTNLCFALSDLQAAQEWAASEYGFEVRESMPT